MSFTMLSLLGLHAGSTFSPDVVAAFSAVSSPSLSSILRLSLSTVGLFQGKLLMNEFSSVLRLVASAVSDV